jgi:thiol:disulfide interchange protein
MRHIAWLAVLAVFALGVAASAEPGKKSIQWFTDFKKAQAAAKKQKKIMMVDFYTDW